MPHEQTMLDCSLKAIRRTMEKYDKDSNMGKNLRLMAEAIEDGRVRIEEKT